MKFPQVQYMVGVETAGEVKYFWGATRIAAVTAAGDPLLYQYVRFDRGPVMLPGGQPAPKRPYKSPAQKELL